MERELLTFVEVLITTASAEIFYPFEIMRLFAHLNSINLKVFNIFQFENDGSFLPSYVSFPIVGIFRRTYWQIFINSQKWIYKDSLD